MTTHSLPAARSRPSSGSLRLRAVVHVTDVVALVLGALLTIAVLGTDTTTAAATVLLLVALGVLGLHLTGCYQRRIVRVRSLELARTTRVATTLGAVVVLLQGLPVTGRSLVAGAVAVVAFTLLLGAGRSAVAEWVRGRRAAGNMRAGVLVAGTGRVMEMASFLRGHPHLGYRVLDAVELLPDVEPVPYLVSLARSVGATGVVVTDAGDPAVRASVRGLRAAGLHVHVATGVEGIGLDAVVTSSSAGELFLDVRPRESTWIEEATMRALDVAVAATVLALTAPLSLVLAAAIRLTDGGPAMFVQQRVGKDGTTFPMMKFRSMTVDAESVEVEGDDGREGPLTKIANDPRVTSVGRLLRATSLDELPQLLNVIRGEMSIVGPRPALPAEVAEFDAELRRRDTVRPGLTGLWQVEARDLPQFDLYRRLDLLYVDNRSPALNVSIILRTVTAVVGQALRGVLGDAEAITGHADVELPPVQLGPGAEQAQDDVIDLAGARATRRPEAEQVIDLRDEVPSQA